MLCQKTVLLIIVTLPEESHYKKTLWLLQQYLLKMLVDCGYYFHSWEFNASKVTRTTIRQIIIVCSRSITWYWSSINLSNVMNKTIFTKMFFVLVIWEKLICIRCTSLPRIDKILDYLIFNEQFSACLIPFIPFNKVL